MYGCWSESWSENLGREVKINEFIIIMLIVAVLFGGLGFWINDYISEPDIEYRTDTTYIKPDTASIIQQARKGYIEYNYDEFVKKFGGIYKDSIITYKDSTVINYKDSIITISTLSADTTFSFEKKDTVKQVKFSAKLDLRTVAFLYPICAIQNTATLRDVTFVTYTTVAKWKWYDNFYVGIGLNMDMKPGLQVGWGLNISDIRRIRK